MNRIRRIRCIFVCHGSASRDAQVPKTDPRYLKARNEPQYNAATSRLSFAALARMKIGRVEREAITGEKTPPHLAKGWSGGREDSPSRTIL